jgi:hypothetical protein
MSQQQNESMRKPVDYDEMFPGRFLKAGLFKGKPATLTIADVMLEDLPQDKGGERTRGILCFRQTKMQLVLNSTNGQCIREMFGRKPADWVGKSVTFVPEKDKFGRETVDAIRVQGSPDIKEAIEVEIRMPRKKPKIRRLVPTGKGANGNGQAKQPEPAPAQPPAAATPAEPEHDAFDDSGELSPEQEERMF